MARVSPFPHGEVGQQNRHSGGGIAGISPFPAGKWEIRRKSGKARAGGGESAGFAPPMPGAGAGRSGSAVLTCPRQSPRADGRFYGEGAAPAASYAAGSAQSGWGATEGAARPRARSPRRGSRGRRCAARRRPRRHARPRPSERPPPPPPGEKPRLSRRRSGHGATRRAGRTGAGARPRPPIRA